MVQNFVANPPFCKVIFLTCRWIEYRYNVELSVLLDRRRHLALVFEVNPCTTFPVATMLMNLRAFYLTAHHFSRSGRAQSHLPDLFSRPSPPAPRAVASARSPPSPPPEEEGGSCGGDATRRHRPPRRRRRRHVRELALRAPPGGRRRPAAAAAAHDGPGSRGGASRPRCRG